MELEVMKAQIIEDGKHEGVITAVEYRDTPHDYTDLVIEFEEGSKLKVGYPTKVMEDNRIGQLLKRFGIVVAVGMKVDPDQLIGKRCEFLTLSKVTDRGTFARIIQESVKPIDTSTDTRT